MMPVYKPKVLIAEPIYNSLKPEIYMNRIMFWESCFQAKALGTYGFKSLVIGPRRAIRSARDLAIQTAVQTNATHLLMIDDDIEVPPHILVDLLAHDKDIIGGLCHRDDGAPIVFRDVDAPEGQGVRAIRGEHEHTFAEDPGEAPWIDHPKHGAFECAAVGAGCLLIKVDALKEIRTNRGPCIEQWEDRWLFNYDQTECSMDVNFCRLARSKGFQIWCLPDPVCVQVQHY